ncbi:hypothetical protein [Solidesulfovibrio magneticus]|uniref:Uncharacterized protein n=1 Tax=Solidesulfovibrio magneticus (strain ATCC 700980 / DSM 13731 / RS-1) TaxID=573370 RepID=C4XK16_SOLM1|nr:hypothetical protein [Solidesulfovibrio magneticus]BAH74371.1 hypothetical protein DMR_08800 [Solidesulfovibrio magneticus RS-1]
MNTIWVFSHIDGGGTKHYRQFESPAGPYYVTARQAGGTKAVGGKCTITGKLFRAQEHDDLTVSHVLVRVIEGIDFEGLREKTVAKFITALTKYAGTEKTMTFASKTAFERFIRDHA